VIFLPLIQTVLFNVACGHDPKHLTLGILNDEPVSQTGTCSLMQTKNCFLDGGVPVSCLVLERLKEKTFELVIFTNKLLFINISRLNVFWSTHLAWLKWEHYRSSISMTCLKSYLFELRGFGNLKKKLRMIILIDIIRYRKQEIFRALQFFSNFVLSKFFSRMRLLRCLYYAYYDAVYNNVSYKTIFSYVISHVQYIFVTRILYPINDHYDLTLKGRYKWILLYLFTKNKK